MHQRSSAATFILCFASATSGLLAGSAMAGVAAPHQQQPSSAGGALSSSSPPDNLLGGSQVWSASRPKHIRVEADFVTCTQ
jgi:hypothetical protein